MIRRERPKRRWKSAPKPPDIVLSDWVMPGMSGLDFCRTFRDLNRESYGCFVLLTSKNEKNEVALGLESGADDFLSKPVNGEELRARLAAGERILTMERELRKKNHLLRDAQEAIERDDLGEDAQIAAKPHQGTLSLVRFGRGDADAAPVWPCGRDLVGFFPINARRVGLFGIDVSGHGIASALMTARLAGYLSGSAPGLKRGADPVGIRHLRWPPPAEVASYLNTLILEEMETEAYFTLIYADVDLISGKVELVQAGHPHPAAVLRADGSVEFFGAGGMPVGLLPGAEYDSVKVVLNPGDRLFLMSDGITEATNAAGELLCEEGLGPLMGRLSDLRGQNFLDALYWGIDAYADGHLGDDVSAVLFEFGSAKQNAD
ncbi:MAG: fused response regulator/phosphatase [Paracoccaceae bacterium]